MRGLDWWANAAVFIASFITAHGYPFFGFSIAIIGNLLFMYWGRIEKRRSFIAFNLLYLANSVYGLYNWWPK